MSFLYDWEGNPITTSQWARLFNDERHVGEDDIGGVTVSTVWMGIDYAVFFEGPPLIFETMIFGGPYDQWQWRYSTVEEAREGHARIVGLLRTGQEIEKWTSTA